MLVVPTTGGRYRDHKVLKLFLNLIPGKQNQFSVIQPNGMGGGELQSPDLTTLASFRIDDFLLFPLLLGLYPVLVTASPVTGVDDVTKKLLVKVGVVEHFRVVFAGWNLGPYPLPLTPVHPRAVDHFRPAGLVGERLGDKLDGVLEFVTRRFRKRVAV